MTNISLTNHVLAAATCITAPIVALELFKSSNLDHIPSIGYSYWPVSYISAFKYMSNAAQILQEGYVKYKGSLLKIPILNRWVVVVGRQNLEDIKKATDNELSLVEAVNDTIKIDYLIGPAISADPYHTPLARIRFPRKLGLYYSDMKDQVHIAFEELLDLKDNGAFGELFVTIYAGSSGSVEERRGGSNHTPNRMQSQQ